MDMSSTWQSLQKDSSSTSICDNRATSVLMESDASICVSSTLIRDEGEADGGLDLSLHSGSTARRSR